LYQITKNPDIARFKIIDYLMLSWFLLSSHFCKKYILLHAGYLMKYQIVMFGIVNRYSMGI